MKAGWFVPPMEPACSERGATRHRLRAGDGCRIGHGPQIHHARHHHVRTHRKTGVGHSDRRVASLHMGDLPITLGKCEDFSLDKPKFGGSLSHPLGRMGAWTGSLVIETESSTTTETT